MFWSIHKDRILLGGIAGALGVITRDLYSFFAKLVGLAKFQVWQRSADLFIKGREIKTFIGNTVGILTDIVFGAILGIIFVYFLKYTNHKNIIIKGWGYGVFAWLFLFGILLTNLPRGSRNCPQGCPKQFQRLFWTLHLRISMGIYAQILLKKFGLLEEGWNRQKTRS